MDKKRTVLDTIEGIAFDELFVIDDTAGTEHTYEDLFTGCLDLAEALEDDYDGQDTVIAVLENGYLLFQLYFTSMLTDKKIVVIDPLKGKDEIAEILKEYREAVVFAESSVSFMPSQNRVLFENKKREKRESDKAQSVKTKVIKRLEARDFDKTYLITYTSGTSGVTKGVKHSLNTLFAAAYALKMAVPDNNSGCFLHVMPMTYMAGILNSIIFPLIMRKKIVIAGRFSVKVAISFWKKAAAYGATLFWLSPSMLLMIDKLDRSKIGEDYCRNHDTCFLIGTAALTDKVREKIEKRYAVRLRASYGLSELLFISVETEETRKRGEKNNVGEFLEGVEYKLEADKELLIRVPWEYLGYTNEDAENYRRGKYYVTGDLAEVRDGILYIVGRKKDLIIKGGLNISPSRIEECIAGHDDIIECAVYAGHDDCGEELVCCAYVCGDNETEALERELAKKVLDELGKNYKIDMFYRLKELPRNINGKIDRARLKEQK